MKTREEVKIQEKESSKLKIENLEIKEINETLMEDLTLLNEKLFHIIPGSLEMECEELKESNSILKVIVQMYKEEEIRNAENQCTKKYSESEVAVNPLKDAEAKTTFACDKCDFTSTSKKGLNVHSTVKHKKPSPYR